eukprot:TRINITY_DN3068_c0_g1_i3.p3 TRINITY_DN3068_c0_g1~~TRINITY_DN3068_c0_g1_i3.p3  ORF type:complete len:144 (-),score=24.90 TRINITY_DN3068_c0_g1_i3:291-722(-)
MARGATPRPREEGGPTLLALVAQEESWARYMKLRLDRVLYMEVEGTQEEVTKCGAPVPEFSRLDSGDKKWVAPYTPYAPGWWNVFMPGAVDAQIVDRLELQCFVGRAGFLVSGAGRRRHHARSSWTLLPLATSAVSQASGLQH